MFYLGSFWWFWCFFSPGSPFNHTSIMVALFEREPLRERQFILFCAEQDWFDWRTIRIRNFPKTITWNNLEISDFSPTIGLIASTNMTTLTKHKCKQHHLFPKNVFFEVKVFLNSTGLNQYNSDVRFCGIFSFRKHSWEKNEDSIEKDQFLGFSLRTSYMLRYKACIFWPSLHIIVSILTYWTRC